MVQGSVRSTKHPKLSNTFEVLRAQAEEPNITDPINEWLEKSGTVDASIPSGTSGFPSEKSNSPSKSFSQKNLDNRQRMRFLTPRIEFRTLTDTKNAGYLKDMLLQLWQHIDGHELRIIPAAFKDDIKETCDTPNKTKPPISEDYFGAPSYQYSEADHTFVRSNIEDILRMADQYRHSGCTDAHWMAIVVSLLLNLVRRLQRYQMPDSEIVVLKMTSVEISPSALCRTSRDFSLESLDQEIDFAMGLDLSYKKFTTLQHGVFSEGTPSINQTASFTNLIPIFANIKVNGPKTSRDPLIQLGIWITAEFNKRKKERYSLDMPVLAIVVEADYWNLYMVFAIEDNACGTFKCSFVGPTPMGSTLDLLGVYRILDKL